MTISTILAALLTLAPGYNNTGYNGGYNQGYAQPQQAAPAPMAPARPDVNASVYDEDIPF